jgi:ribosomal protein S18 acetylase RimI-like enzyme
MGGAPLVANVMTAPQAQNQGMATVLLRQAMNALLAHGYADLYLFVTEGNGPAQHVYQALGFVVIATLSREHERL